jgi:hypothetical protein
VSWSPRFQTVSAELAAMVHEYWPRFTAKKLARVLGCSIRSGKRYAAHPELFPRSRAEELLAALEAEEAAMEERRIKRQQQLEGVRRELMAQLGLDGPRIPLPRGRMAGRRVGGTVVQGRGRVPPPSG